MTAIGYTYKTALSVVDEIVQVLVDANVVDAVGLTGEIRRLNRRLNSKVEDVVINPVSLSTNQMQRGTFNVNIHVPNLVNQPSGTPNQVDQTQPNIDRMSEIAKACMDALNENYLFDCLVDIGNGGEPIQDGNNWYLNIELDYYSPRDDQGI